jgi:nitroreductase
MIKGSEIRKADHPIEALLLDRWSPRAMSGEEIPEEELMRLFEAARWAPSSFNAQQWRALYARRGTEHWQSFFDLLVEANKTWAKNAAVLVVFISRKFFDYNDEPSVRIHMMLEQRGRISRCKASAKVWWCMAWKASFTSARAESCEFQMIPSGSNGGSRQTGR